MTRLWTEGLTTDAPPPYFAVYRRHYGPDEQEQFDSWEELLSWVEAIDDQGSAYVAELKAKSGPLWTRFDPFRGWVRAE